MHFQLHRRLGKTAVAAVDKMDVLGFIQIKYQACNEGVIGQVQTVGDAVAETQIRQTVFQRRRLFDASIEHQAQHVVKAPKIRIEDQS